MKSGYADERVSDFSSLPSWERGLKCTSSDAAELLDLVAPLVGAWIEIAIKTYRSNDRRVAPLVGAWIEIFVSLQPSTHGLTSLPSWERGLKFPVLAV